MKPFKLLFVVSVLLLSSACAQQPNPGTQEKGSRIIRGLHYQDSPVSLADVFLPARSSRPAPIVIFFSGGDGKAKSTGGYEEMARFTAKQGYAAVVFDRRQPRAPEWDQSLTDCEALIAYVRMHAAHWGVDRDRIVVWAASGGGMNQKAAFNKPYVRGLLSFYAVFDPEDAMSDLSDEDKRRIMSRVSPLQAFVNGASAPPLFIVKAGKDRDVPNIGIDKFVAAVSKRQLSLEFILYSNASHGFDFLEHVPETEYITKRAFEFIEERIK
jgi:acetyl esterase/lipase